MPSKMYQEFKIKCFHCDRSKTIHWNVVGECGWWYAFPAESISSYRARARPKIYSHFALSVNSPRNLAYSRSSSSRALPRCLEPLFASNPAPHNNTKHTLTHTPDTYYTAWPIGIGYAGYSHASQPPRQPPSQSVNCFSIQLSFYKRTGDAHAAASWTISKYFDSRELLMSRELHFAARPNITNTVSEAQWILKL